MTGILPSTSGVYHNSQPWRLAMPKAVTLPQHFTQHGYWSAGSGKIYHGKYPDPASWQTYFPDQQKNKPNDPLPAKRPVNGIPKTAHFDWGPVAQPPKAMGDYQVADWIIGQLKRDHDKPFFLACGIYRPHLPWYVPQKYFDLYQNNQKVPEHYIPYYAAISQFDDTVGDLVNYVEGKGLAGNTLFVFVVDNGWTPSTRRHKIMKNFFHHTEESKRSPFEDGLRTPILFRWDKRITPARHELLCSSIDIAPTLLHIIGQSQNAKALPGINLLDADARRRHACARSGLRAEGRDDAARRERIPYVKVEEHVKFCLLYTSDAADE